MVAIVIIISPNQNSHSGEIRMKEGQLKWGLPVFSFASKVKKCQRWSVDDFGSGEDADDNVDEDDDDDDNSALKSSWNHDL